jgi:hypothetical protein
MLFCGNCSGVEGCGADGTPNVCGTAVYAMCGGCGSGGAVITILYDTMCDSTSDCRHQSMPHVLCAKVPGVWAGCPVTCLSNEHSVTFPSCDCTANGGMTTVCIPNP